MPSPAINTKIERVVEAIEALSMATVAAVTVGVATQKSIPVSLAVNVVDARQELSTALTEFLAPTLRVVPTEPPPNEAA